MTRVRDLARTIRIGWMLVGGLMGASIGVGAYRSLPPNADGLGTMFAQGFFLWSAVIGLVAGMALGALIGRAAEALLRRVGSTAPVALGLATVVSVIMLAQIRGRVLARYPGLHQRADASQRAETSRRVAITADSSARQLPAQHTCAAAAPVNERELRLWRDECR